MKKIITVIVLLATLSPLFSQEKQADYIEVNGYAEKEFTPDKIILMITLTEKENKRRGSLEEMEEDLFLMLQKTGINPEKDVTIDNIEATMEKFFLRKNSVALTKSFIVTTTDSKQLTLLFEELEKAEITDVRILSTELSTLNEAAALIIEEAAANAKNNAISIAKGLGVKLGKAIYAHSYSNFPREQQFQPKFQYARGVQMDQEAEEAVRVIPEFRKIKLSHTVTVRFSLE